jgi:signal transduction histidine kinase
MKKQKTIRSILLLMVLSQVLLAAFVLQWLDGRYAAEKANLRKELSRVFESAKQEMLDSTVQQKVINPLLGKGDSIQISLDLNSDSVSKSQPGHSHDPHIRKIIHVEHGQKMIFYSDDSNEIPASGQTERHKLPGNSADLLLREIKLVINDARQRKTLPGNGMHALGAYDADTVLMRKLCEHTLKAGGFHFSYIWGRPVHTDLALASLYFESSFFSQAYGLTVSGFRTFLFRKLAADIVFAFLLLLITLLAFILSYLGLRKQYQLNLLKDEFIANISHELKTPVATVKLSIEALQQFETLRKPEVMQEYLQMASLEISRLEALISRVMDATMLESGVLPLLKEPVDLKILSEEVVASINMRLEAQEAEVKITTGSGATIALADSVHLRGVLLNLLDNSLKYRASRNKIDIDLSGSAGQVVLKLCDNGPGIPEEYIKKVFERFFRVPDKEGHLVKGHGLGLNYVQQIMEQSGGSISLCNREGGGLCAELIFLAGS